MKHFLIFFLLLVGVVSYAQPAPPNLSASPSPGAGSICPNNFVWLTATGCDGGTVDWQGIIGPSQGNSTFTLSGGQDVFPNTFQETVYATCTDGSGTSAPAAVTYDVRPKPRVMTVTGPTTACNGVPLTVTGSNCQTGSGVANIIWADGQSCPGVSSCTISFTLFSTFDVGPSCSDGLWGCASDPAPFQITVSPATPDWQWTNNYQCNGNTVERQRIDANPCSAAAPEWVTVDATGCTPPVVTATPSPICIGQSVNVSIANCAGGSVSWTPTGSGQAFTDSPTSDITYTGTCTNSYGLNTGSSSASVQVINLSAPAVSASASNIILGQSVNISATGCPGTLNWSPVGSGASFTDSPTGNITYTATCSYNGCTSPAGSVAVTVTNVPVPTVSASPAAICQGQSSILTASGCSGTYTWSTGENGASITVSPASSQNYQVTCTISGVTSGPASTGVTVNPIPGSPGVSSSLGNAICAGQSTVLTASGCNGTYTWSTGETGPSITVSPAASQLYSVNCTENGCSGPNGTAGITVNPLPTAPTISADQTNVCAGTTVNLTAAGCTGTVNWSDGGNGATRTYVVNAAGTLTATCSDACGTSGPSNSLAFTLLPAPTAPTISANTAGICAGGSVNLTAAGCTGTVNWSDGGVGATRTITPAASLAITATCTDACGTSGQSNVIGITVNPLPTAPTISADQTNVCAGTTVNLTAAGCTGTVNWSDGGNGATRTYVVNAAGTLTATCSDACGTSGPSNSLAFTLLPAPTAPTISADQTNVCAGTTVNLTAAGCAGTVSWSDGGSGATRTYVVNSAATITATCSTGCGTSSPSNGLTFSTLPAATAPTISADQTNICAGGSINLTAAGCTGTITWSDGGAGTTRTISPASSLVLTATCTETCGTSGPSNGLSITVNPIPAAPTASATQHPTCAVSTGTIVVSAPAGAEYSVDGVNYQASGTFAALGAGTYNVTARVAGCISAPTSVVINAPAGAPGAPTVTVNAQPTCSVATGSASANSYGAGFEYSLDGGAFQASPAFTGIAAGNHSIAVREIATGCTSAGGSFVINAQPATPAAPTASATQQPTCSDATGTIVVSAPSGYEYSVDGVNYQASATFAGLGAGTYNVTARSAGGCVSAPTSVVINAQPSTPAAPSASVTVQPTCAVATGTIVVSAPAGAEYSVDGVNYQASGTFAGLGAGTYNVTARVAAGCVSAPTALVINAPGGSPATPTITVNAQPTCAVATGSASANSYGAGFEYSLDGGAFQASPSFAGIAAGNHSIAVREIATGCTSANGSFVINAQPATPAAPTASATQHPTCAVSTGTIVVSAPAGAEYSVDGVNYQASGTFAALGAGTYNVTARNAAGCVSAPTSVVINAQPSAPATPTITVNAQPTCAVATGSASANSYGAGFEYSLDGGAFQASPAFTGIAAGNHSIAVREIATGCTSANGSFVINAQPATPAAPSVSANPTTVFAGDPSVLTATGCAGTYTWSTGQNGASITVNPLVQTTYTVNCTENGCQSADASVTVFIKVAGSPLATNDAATMLQGTGTVISVLANDLSDAGVQATTANVTLPVVTVNPLHGAVVVNADGTINYDPAVGYVGTDQFTYQICNPAQPANCATAIVSLNISASAVMAVNDNATTPQGTAVTTPVLANDSPGTTNPTIIGNPAHGSVVVNANGTVTYTPNASYAGPDSYTYSIANPLDATKSATAVVTITVTPNAVAANDDNVSTPQGTPTTIPVLTNDTPGTTIPTITGQPTSGTATVNPDGTITYTPAPNTVGPVSFTYSVCNPAAPTVCDDAVVTVQVNATAVTAVNDNATTPQGTAVTTPVLANDSPGTTNPTIIGNPAHGSVVVNANGTVTYTPNAGYAGPDSYTYSIANPLDATKSATAVVTITVTPNAVAANDDNASTPQGTPVTVPVLTNDSPGTTTPVITGQPATGTASVNPDGTITYTPDPNVVGPISFTYSVCNPADPTVCDPAVVTVQVNASAVVANDDNATTPQGTAVTTPVLANDSPGTTNPTIIGNPAHGSVVVNANGTVTYTPNAGYVGPDSYTYSIANPLDPTKSATAVVSVNVTPNAVAANDDNASTPQGTPVTVPVLTNDTPGTTTPVITGQPATGTASVNPDGTITYTPAPNTVGPVSFTYSVCNPAAPTVCDDAVVTVQVNATAVTAVNDNATTPQGTAVTTPVLANDSPGTTNPTIIGNPAHGSVVVNANGTVTYTPNAGYAGPDSYTYSIANPLDATKSATAVVTITVTPNAVAANDDNASTPQGTPVTVPVLTNDTPGTTTPVITGQPATGTASVNPDGTITYTPAPNTVGPVSFTYSVCNPAAPTVCDDAVVTVQVNATAVTAVNDNATTPQGTAVTTPVLANDSPGTTNPTIIGNPAHGSVVVNANGTVTYTPNAGYVGPDSYTYSIANPLDPTKSATAVVSVNVTPNAVAANDDNASTPQGTPVTVPVLTNDTPGTTTPVITGQPATGTASVNPDGTITYTPAPNTVGPVSFTYSVCNPAAPTVCDDAVVTVNVNCVISAPAATVSAQPTCANATGTISIQGVAGETYSIDGLNYSASTSFPALSAGVYNVTAKNAAGCISGATILTINAQPATPSAPAATVSAQPTCANATGTISIQGVAGETYSIDGLNYSASTSFPALSAGVYNVTAKNAQGCVSAPVMLTINAQPGTPSAPAATVSAQPTCANATGTISIQGVAGETYSINGLNYSASTSFSGLSAGVYNVTSKNAQGCVSAPVMLTINAQPGTPSAPAATVSAQPTCANATGTISIQGVAGETYSIDGVNYSASTSFPALSAGVYNVTSKNAQGCVSAPVMLTINAQPGTPAAPAATVSVKPTCTVSTGSISIQGVAGMMYSIDGVNYLANTLFENLAIGTYSVTAKSGAGCISAATSLTISKASCPIDAVDDAVVANYNSVVSIPVLANDKDRAGMPASLTTVTIPVIVTQSTNGTAVVNADGSISFTPRPGFQGTTSFSYQICDAVEAGNCDIAQVVVAVGGKAPDAVNDMVNAPYNTAVTVPVLANDKDRNGDPATLASVTLPVITQVSAGTAVVNPDGTISVTPPTGFVGAITVIYEICDRADFMNKSAATYCDNAVVTVNVASKAPVAVTDNASGAFGSVITVDVLANDKDRDGNAAALAMVTAPVLITNSPNGTASITNGVLSFTPSVGFSGTTVVTYQICDKLENSKCSSASVVLTVGPDPCAPGQGKPLKITKVTLNCYTDQICIETCGGDGSPTQFFGIGVGDWGYEKCVMVGDDLVHRDPKILVIKGVQSGVEETFIYDLPSASAQCPDESRPWNRNPASGTPPPGVVVTIPGSPTGATGQPLSLIDPAYNCTTGAITFKYAGGDGTAVEFKAIGVTGWSTDPIHFVDAGLRIDQPTITIEARQSGRVVSRTFNLKAYCATFVPETPPASATISTPAPTTTTPPSATTAITGDGVFRLIDPLYNCSTGVFTFRWDGNTKGDVEYMAIGITGWTKNPNHVIDAGLRNDANLAPFVLKARQNGKEVEYTWDLKYFCTQVAPVTPPSTTVTPPPTTTATPPSTTTATPSSAFRLVVPSYNCATGQFGFKYEGGDGSRVEFMAVGITGWTQSAGWYTVQPAPDADAFILYARQSGVIVQYVWDWKGMCNGSTPPVVVNPVVPETPVVTPPAPVTISAPIMPGADLKLVAPEYVCATGEFTFKSEGGNGSPIEFMAVGITGWTSNAKHVIEAVLRNDPTISAFVLHAKQSGKVVSYTWKLQDACGSARVATRVEVPLEVTIFGNPTLGEEVEIRVTGATSKMMLNVVDLQGNNVSIQEVESPDSNTRYRIKLGKQAGMYLLNVSTQSQSKTVKVIRQ